MLRVAAVFRCVSQRRRGKTGQPCLRPAPPETRTLAVTRQQAEAPSLAGARLHRRGAWSPRRSSPPSAGSGRRPAGFLASPVLPRAPQGWSVGVLFGHLSGPEKEFDLLRAFSSCDIDGGFRHNDGFIGNRSDDPVVGAQQHPFFHRLSLPALRLNHPVVAVPSTRN